jgi:hypothetical protein
MTNSTETDRPGITFAVDKVLPATGRLDESRAHVAVKQMLSGPINSCSDYHSMVIANVHFQPLLAAVYMAYSQHRPLVLTPDAVWITITQGVAHHMAVNAERRRDRFVSHQGKETLTFTCEGWVLESPENPWPEAFRSWSSQIRGYVGPRTHDVLRCDFSTTGPVEQAVSDIVMMDIFQQYFHYEAYSVCGIPSITLEGTPTDWQRLCEKAQGLRVFDMDWWLEHLLPICDQLARASRGDVDREHWQNICKLRKDYGGDIINGWIARLFPYLLQYIKGPCNRRNPIFETGEGFQTLFAPSGLSCVPFTFIKGETGEERLMQAVGGLLGISQDAETLALRPKLGWAIREASKLDALMARLSSEHTTRPEDAAPPDDKTRAESRRDYLPPDLGRFYTDFPGGVSLFGSPSDAPYRVLSRKRMKSLDWREEPEIGNSRGPDGRTWHRLVDLADGSFLAIDLDMNRYRFNPDRKADWDVGKYFSPICHCRLETIGTAGANPVIAYSFSELLQRVLDSRGKLFWLEPGFKSYGDADQFIRRESTQRTKKSS